MRYTHPMSIGAFAQKTFSSLAIRNYRLYFFGQAISFTGTWVHTVALGWLTLQLTGSGTALGGVVALQFVPLLLFGAYGGVLVDRLDKRKMLYYTNAAFCVVALLLGLAVVYGIAAVWMVYLCSLCFGLIRIIDNPVRQSFVSEMVEPEYLKNAVSLNSTTMNLARAVGPTVAGIVIAAVGVAACFILNALSYLFVIFMVAQMRSEELRIGQRTEALRGKVMEGFRYVLSEPIIRKTLLMMAVIGTLSYEFEVSIPILGQNVFHADVAGYASLFVAFGIGAVVGGLVAAGRHEISPHHMYLYAFFFGVAIMLVGAMPTLFLAALMMSVVGFLSINLTSTANTMIQLAARADMRGRVMALWSIAVVGSTAIGGPIIGYIGEHAGGRLAFVVSGAAAILAAALTYFGPDIRRIIPQAIQIRIFEAEVEEGVKMH